MLVVGGKEEENEAVSVRSRFKGDEGQMKLDDFLAAIKEEIANRENRKVEKKINCQMKRRHHICGMPPFFISYPF